MKADSMICPGCGREWELTTLEAIREAGNGVWRCELCRETVRGRKGSYYVKLHSPNWIEPPERSGASRENTLDAPSPGPAAKAQ
jgi:ribosomal protein L37AE/L43A